MNPPERRDVSQLIAAPCLVATDRAGRGLFVSDYPRRLSAQAAAEAAERLSAAGYEETRQDGLATLDWSQQRCLRYYDELPPDGAPPEGLRAQGIWRTLRQHLAPLHAQDAAVLRQALRWAHLKDTDKLYTLLETATADALRERRAPPHYAARLLGAPGPDERSDP